MTQATYNMPEEDCLTIISPEADLTTFEFHRQRLGKQGYTLCSKVLQHNFEMVDENSNVTRLFEGERFYAATYIKATHSNSNSEG